MIIVKILGGLGNQMFQYALYRSLKEKKEDVKVDLSNFNEYELHNGFELNKIFNIKVEQSASRDNIKIADSNKSFSSKIRRKILGRRKSFIREENGDFNRLDKLKNAYLEGYWQSETFFKDVEDKIKEDFTFTQITGEQNKEVLKQIENSESVSIHIRRGDYITNPKVYETYGKICDIKYYKKAINKIKERVDNPTFFIVSNDIDWAKENLGLEDQVTYIDWNNSHNSYMDMYLISKCKHNIIANSSFSWWGAWLNSYDNKIVVAPNKWKIAKEYTENRIPNDWVTIEV